MSRWMIVLLGATWLQGAQAREPAQADDDATQAPARTEGAARGKGSESTLEDEIAEKVIVISDGFKRWDGTRWNVQTQFTFPTPFPVQAFRNKEFEAVAAQVRLVMSCEKTFRRNNKRFEVDCHVDDVGLQMAPLRSRRKLEDIEAVLQEWDDVLTGADLQLVVADDGRVTQVDLEGIQGPDGTARDADTVRGQTVREEIRALLRLTMAAFHMRLPAAKTLREGQWVEYEPALFQIPMLDNTMSGAFLVHQLDTYKGHNVVQSKGRGTVRTGQADDDSDQNFYKLTFDGVAIYDDNGVMTERVWALQGTATASSLLGDLANVGYFHSGRIRQLGEKEPAGAGPTRAVGLPGKTEVDDRPVWVPIE